MSVGHDCCSLTPQVARAEVGQLPWEKMDERYAVLSGEREERCGHGANRDRARCCALRFQLEGSGRNSCHSRRFKHRERENLIRLFEIRKKHNIPKLLSHSPGDRVIARCQTGITPKSLIQSIF